MRHYESIPAWPLAWLKEVKLEHVKAGAIHSLPDDGRNYIYAGTVFQVSNVLKIFIKDDDILILTNRGHKAIQLQQEVEDGG